MPVKVIINPIAGAGRALKAWSKVEDYLTGNEFACDAEFTRARRHATEIAQAAAEEGYDTIIVIAGDGTLHEVVNGMVGTGISLGVIPAGRGNDLARSLGISTDPLAAARTCLHGHLTHIDLGKANGEYFFNVAGVGFDAEVCQQVNQGRLYVNGPLTYVVYVLKMLWYYRPVVCRITLDEKTWEQPVFLLVAGNGRYFGGGMLATPGADLYDGVFEVVIAGDVTRLEALQALSLIYSGKHVHLPKIQTYRARRVRVESVHSLNIEADGEVIGCVPLSMETLRAALPVWV